MFVSICPKSLERSILSGGHIELYQAVLALKLSAILYNNIRCIINSRFIVLQRPTDSWAMVYHRLTRRYISWRLEIKFVQFAGGTKISVPLRKGKEIAWCKSQVCLRSRTREIPTCKSHIAVPYDSMRIMHISILLTPHGILINVNLSLHSRIMSKVYYYGSATSALLLYQFL